VSWAHHFGHQNDKGRYSVTNFSGPGAACPHCAGPLALSDITRWSYLAGRPLRPDLCPGNA
jgi:hypothetical protein